MKKILVIIPGRGLGNLVFHLPLLKSLYATYKTKINIYSNKSNKAREVFKNEDFVKSVEYFELNHKNLIFNLKDKINYLKQINSFKSDLMIITQRHSSLIIPYHLCNAKKKIMFDLSFFYFKKKETLKLLNCQKIFQNTKKLNLQNFIADFKLKNNFNNTKFSSIFFNLDSHHNQNNWDINNFLKVIKNVYTKFDKIYINYLRTNIELDKKITEKIHNKKKIVITKNLSLAKLIKILKKSKIIVGNESGPICLGLSYGKTVFSLYSPVNTSPESSIINGHGKYYNTNKYSDKILIEKITKGVLLNT